MASARSWSSMDCWARMNWPTGCAGRSVVLTTSISPSHRRSLDHALAVVLACVAAALAAVPGAAQTSTVTLVGAGDIASCSQTNDSATARLLGRIPGTVFTLGDNVQGQGARSEFRDCYDSTWGKYKNRTKPTAGNHDYYTTGAKPYYDYFGARA